MRRELALRLLGEVMKWNDTEARKEFDWLRLMSRFKYDGYGDYLAGMRFVESLARWLQQFAQLDERRDAYRFVKQRLIYVSHTEMNRLVERFYPVCVQPKLAHEAAKRAQVPEYRVWTDERARRHFETLKRRTLFLGMSDGARIDLLRRANVGVLSNEQVVMGTQLDTDKWRDLAKKLREDRIWQNEAPAERKFVHLYLLDDFSASGTTLLRKTEECWKGKLCRFWQSMESIRRELADEFPIVPNPRIYVHHYLATGMAMDNVTKRIEQACADKNQWLQGIEFSAGMLLDDACRLNHENADDAQFLALADKYYNPILVDEHTEESGCDHMRYGYAACALPLILEHNTPNNSVSLLWADTQDRGSDKDHMMRPLFRRRSRHN